MAVRAYKTSPSRSFWRWRLSRSFHFTLDRDRDSGAAAGINPSGTFPCPAIVFYPGDDGEPRAREEERTSERERESCSLPPIETRFVPEIESE